MLPKINKNCHNIIHISYLENKEINLDISNKIEEEFNSRVFIYVNSVNINDNELVDEIVFDSILTAPLQFLQSLCNTYNIDIIGVAYEFTDGYVESFELKNELIKDEDESVHILSFINNDENSELEIIDELPKSQDDDILEEFSSIDEDDFILNCKTILE